MERIASKFKAWEEDNKVELGAVVNSDHVKLIAEHMELSIDEAEDALRRNEGDLTATLTYLVAQ